MTSRLAPVGSALSLLASLLALSFATPSLGEEPPAVDRAALVEAVRAAELAFAATVAERRPEAFAAMIDDDAAFVGAGGEVLRGREAIVAGWAPLFRADAPEFAWRPEVVELSGDGTLGLTRGPWTMRGRDSQGAPVERSGTFNSIWRQQADGGWRIVFDAGCDGCPDCG